MLNELYSILMHTMRNYVLHIPNDPVREKAGWTQDVESFGDAELYSMDCRSMYVKWQHDFLDIIHENGYVPPVTPGRFDGPTINCPWWGGMIVYLPWKLWQYFGDRQILEESYEAMKSYTGYLQSIDSSGIVSWGLGDWLEPGSVRPVMTPVPLTSTVGYYNTALITSKTAALLGHPEEAKKYGQLAETIKSAFNSHFLNPSTGEYAKGSQTSQIMPLVFGMVPEEKRQMVIDRLVAKIASGDDHVGTGFVGTPQLLIGLSDLGLGELAYTMANQRTYPSWYDMVFNHGTKIFKEDWAGGAVQMPPLGGGLGHWFYYSLAGIRPDPDGPGFRKIIIRPDMVPGLTHASGEYRSVYGLIRSEWKRENNRFTLDIDIPANTTATVYMPSKEGAGGYSVRTTGSGHYQFTEMF
jgi:alpha-L-rhamnosidase